jgi:hypothetical protein
MAPAQKNKPLTKFLPRLAFSKKTPVEPHFLKLAKVSEG